MYNKITTNFLNNSQIISITGLNRAHLPICRRDLIINPYHIVEQNQSTINNFTYK